MIVGTNITELYLTIPRLCKTLLNGIYSIHLLLCSSLIIAHKHEHWLAVLLVCLTDCVCLRIIVEIVVASAKSETCLTDRNDVHVCLTEVCTYAKTEHQSATALTVDVWAYTHILLTILDGTNTLKERFNRLITLLVTTDRVHHLVVECAYLLTERSLGLRIVGKLKDKLIDLLLVKLIEINKRAVTCLVWTKWMVLDECTCGIFHKVITRLHAKVHVSAVIAFSRLGACSYERTCKGKQDKWFLHFWILSTIFNWYNNDITDILLYQTHKHTILLHEIIRKLKVRTRIAQI